MLDIFTLTELYIGLSDYIKSEKKAEQQVYGPLCMANENIT